MTTVTNPMPSYTATQAPINVDTEKFYLITKRMFDIAVSGLALLVLLPVFAVIATLIKITDGGSVFFRQTRVGKDGKHFDFFKFRSMVPNADALKAKIAEQNHHQDQRTFKMKRDPRVTWIGRILRRTSLDEIPQLWNILKGDMSLVGPRPPVPAEVKLYSRYDFQRLSVIPGLTCIWQVEGRGDIPFSQQVELDLEYIRTRNFLVDLSLIAKTVPAVISGKGAY